LKVPALGYGQIYKILCGKVSNKKQYEVTIGNFPAYICMDFVTMVSSSLGKQGKWVHVNTWIMYYNNVMFCGQFEIFIHFLT
jgi:hypothetical protein